MEGELSSEPPANVLAFFASSNGKYKILERPSSAPNGRKVKGIKTRKHPKVNRKQLEYIHTNGGRILEAPKLRG